MVYSLGEVSGAHLNPAVTVGFFFANRFDVRLVFPYVLCQCSGALLASLLLRFLFPNNATLGATLAFGGVYQSLIIEIVLTMILMIVILSMSVCAKEIQSMSGIVIGSVIALGALFAGPISGASMNPARSLGPALISGNLQYLWLYIFAPVLGAFVGVALWKLMHGERLPEPSSPIFQSSDNE